MRVLLTGATGFAGGYILKALLKANITVRAPVRHLTPCLPKHSLLETPLIDDLLTADWTGLCDHVDVIIHAAAYAHDDRADPQAIFRVNCDATAKLADAASEKGARFIFLSSIRAQAGVTSPVPLQDDDPPHPDGPYGEAKLAAEKAIAARCADHISLRLAPLYGPGVKGNLATLLKIAQSPLPLPFGALTAKRSLLSVKTLADLIVHLLHDTSDLRGVYLVAEPGPLSLSAMITALRQARGHSPRLMPVPASLIKTACLMLNRPLLWARLGEPLIVSDDIALGRLFPHLFTMSEQGLRAWATGDKR